MGYVVELQPSLGPALVVGGGAVAARKVGGLAAAGFTMTVVAPDVDAAIVAEKATTVVRRGFEDADVTGHSIVFACTDSREVNEAVGRAARAAGVPVIVADSQAESTAFTPAIYRDGRLTVAVSTGGGAPRLAGEIRDELADALGPGAGERVEQAARARRNAAETETEP